MGIFGGTAREVIGDIFDPLDIFGRPKDKQREAENLEEYGRVVGFGGGPEARAEQAAYMDNLRTSAGYGGMEMSNAIDRAAHAGDYAGSIAAAGDAQLRGGAMDASIAQQEGRGMVTDSLDAADARAQQLMETGTAGAGGIRSAALAGRGDILGTAGRARGDILAAAAPPGSSVAEAQLAGALARNQQDTLSAAAGMSRGGNAALAQRQALGSLASQNTATATGLAQLRAQEEAAIRNQQIQAATAAGQIGSQAGVQAGQLLTTGATQAGQLQSGAAQGAAQTGQAGYTTALQANQGLGGLGVQRMSVGGDLSQTGITGLNQSGAIGGNIAGQLRGQSMDQFHNMGVAQTNTDTGFGTNAQKREAEKQAGLSGIVGGVLGAFI